MSKEAALRAMREARFNKAAAAPGPARPARQPAPTAPSRPAASAPAPKAAATPAPEPADEGLCGHRSMNGRTCTREHGHAAKSHRYS
ncbi:hypothetical protein [Nocardioides stalactiti]|uniref:hypothetical protein n=1 Tax=Nocardioides stalactiti TaxID=2755356 RepID=UPI001600E01E|nr:hypothetical protein [Nocardioides stalactiti]